MKKAAGQAAGRLTQLLGIEPKQKYAKGKTIRVEHGHPVANVDAAAPDDRHDDAQERVSRLFAEICCDHDMRHLVALIAGAGDEFMPLAQALGDLDGDAMIFLKGVLRENTTLVQGSSVGGGSNPAGPTAALVSEDEDHKFADEWRKDGKELLDCISGGFDDWVKMVIGENRRDLNNFRDARGYSVLHLGAEAAQPTLVKYFIECGADVNAQDNDGCTAIQTAAQWGRIPSLTILLELGAKVSHENRIGWRAIHWAANSPHGHKTLQIMRLLKRHGADPNAATHDGTRPLHLAARKGQNGSMIQLAQFLMEFGADVNETDKVKWTALHYAAEGGDFKMVQFLVTEAKADPNLIDKWGKSPYAYVVQEQDNSDFQDDSQLIGDFTDPMKQIADFLKPFMPKMEYPMKENGEFYEGQMRRKQDLKAEHQLSCKSLEADLAAVRRYERKHK